MFVDFLFELRRHKIKVTAHEWQALLEGLALGLHESTLTGFYDLARAVCVKDVAQFDAFDQAFAVHFKGALPDPNKISAQLREWLSNPKKRPDLTPEEIAALEKLDIEEIKRMLEERLQEQTERHDGGNHWVGTGGTSPFGNNGVRPGGMRMGGKSGGMSAVEVAQERHWRAYRQDVVLDVRQMDVALRALRQLGREGAEDELDLDETIDATGRNAGDLELVFHPPRRNRAKVLLLMDVGGSMDPYAELASRLFTAASRSGRFAKFRSYYFHNCVYGNVYEDANFREKTTIHDLLRHSDRDEKLVMLGDAYMDPSELLAPMWMSHAYAREGTSGIDWLRRLAEHFRRAVWLNPRKPDYWGGTTSEVIASVIPMYPLTLDGLSDAVRYLVRGGHRPVVEGGQFGLYDRAWI